MRKEIKAIEKLEKEKQKIINKIKKAIKVKRGDLHNWESYSVHHGWTWWYKCDFCGEMTSENTKLTEENKNEKCSFFNKTYIPTIEKLEEINKPFRFKSKSLDDYISNNERR